MKINRFALLPIAAALLISCADVETLTPTLPPPRVAVLTATFTPTLIPSATASPTLTPTATASATFTSTATASPPPPTNTPKPKATLRPTDSPTPTPVILQAGNYPQTGKCVQFELAHQIYTLTYIWCITSVLVEDSGNLLFTATWYGDNRGQVTTNWIKKPDANNHNLYVTDNLGLRYDHIATDGGARDGGMINTNTEGTLKGTFTFPPAQPGAYRFMFVDDDWQATIPDIILTTPEP